MQQNLRVIKKADFPPLLSQMWRQFKPEWAAAGFREAGVELFNAQVIPVSSFKSSELFTAPLQEENSSDEEITV